MEKKLEFNGVTYPIKEYNGYIFATENLFNDLTDTSGELVSEKAEETDNLIAFYYEEEEFNTSTPKELFEIWDQHS